QHHASMRNYRLPQDANHRRGGIRQPPGAERRIFVADAQDAVARPLYSDGPVLCCCRCRADALIAA
ncbi:MAG TPA: hypothetical protein VN609_07540, partial [Propionibacteriaceae bacterium]|nr:hypothetical protein [Propionibacteriaceae bacterium]